MTKLLLLICAILLLVRPATAAEVLVVQSVHSAAYEEAVRGFRKACTASTRTLVLSDYADPELGRVIREERPRLVVAVGDGAVSALHRVRRKPALALMALSMPGQEPVPCITGVHLFVKPEQYLSLFRKMKARRVGVLYDPARTGWYVREARAAARQHGMELVLREVKESRHVMAHLSSLKGVDALWLIPDTTAVTRETLEGYFLFGQKQSVPVVSFSKSHLKLGAVAAVEADGFESGRQGGEMALQLLRGVQPADLPPAAPRRGNISINEAVARRFGYPADLAALVSPNRQEQP